MSAATTPDATPERRAWVRHPHRLALLWQFLGVADKEIAAGAFDLSASGVGLVFHRELAPGTLLTLRLPTATRGWSTYLVRVKHLRRVAPGQFQAGCAFVKPLRPEQLAALLGEKATSQI